MHRLREKLKAMHSVELGPPPMPFHHCLPGAVSHLYCKPASETLPGVSSAYRGGVSPAADGKAASEQDPQNPLVQTFHFSGKNGEFRSGLADATNAHFLDLSVFFPNQYKTKVFLFTTKKEKDKSHSCITLIIPVVLFALNFLIFIF